MYIRNDLPGKDEPIPSKGNDDNLEDQEGDETLWRHDIKKGWIRKRAVYIYSISNRRVVSGSQVLKLDEVSDYVSVSEERFYGGGVNSVGTHSRGVNARLSSYPGRGRIVADVIFTSPSKEDVIFHDVPDPDGVVRLFKSLKKSRQQQQK
jgi:hypothetical protein